MTRELASARSRRSKPRCSRQPTDVDAGSWRRLGARWYAVYVETPGEGQGRIRPGDAEALAQNIRLAESLGATVVRVKAAKPAEGLVAFAQREGVTHVIFGQSARGRMELLWRGSTLDRFLGAVPDAAVQVVPLSDG